MPATAAEMIELARRFFRWWFGELAAVIPRRLRERLQPTAEMLVVLCGEHDALLFFQNGRALKQLGRIEGGPPPRPAQRLRALLETHGLVGAARGGRLGACLRIPAERAVRTIAELPLAAEENLDEVLSFELDRHTPFPAERAAFSSRVVRRDPEARRLKVELTVVPTTTIEQVMRLAHDLDIEPDRIDVAEPVTNLSSSQNLLPATAKASRLGAHRLTYALGAIAACLVVVAVYLPIDAAQHNAAIAAQEFAKVKVSTEAAAKLQKEIDSLRAEDGFLIDRKHKMPTISQLLFETTRILPDDSWLVDWQLISGEIQLTGYARSASALVEHLEQSHIFHGTTFRSPVTLDAGTGRERFTIATQVIRGPTQ